MSEDTINPQSQINTLPVTDTNSQADGQKSKSFLQANLGLIFVAAFVFAVFWGGFLWLIVWLASNQAAEVEAVRDVMIIILAIQSCVFGIAALVLLVIVVRLVNMLEFEIRPILEKTNETLGTVQGTTTFVGDNVVKPTIRAKSHLAGIRKGLKTLFGNPRDNIP